VPLAQVFLKDYAHVGITVQTNTATRAAYLVNSDREYQEVDTIVIPDN